MDLFETRHRQQMYALRTSPRYPLLFCIKAFQDFLQWSRRCSGKLHTSSFVCVGCCSAPCWCWWGFRGLQVHDFVNTLPTLATLATLKQFCSLNVKPEALEGSWLAAESSLHICRNLMQHNRCTVKVLWQSVYTVQRCDHGWDGCMHYTPTVVWPTCLKTVLLLTSGHHGQQLHPVHAHSLWEVHVPGVGWGPGLGNRTRLCCVDPSRSCAWDLSPQGVVSPGEGRTHFLCVLKVRTSTVIISTITTCTAH